MGTIIQDYISDRINILEETQRKPNPIIAIINNRKYQLIFIFIVISCLVSIFVFFATTIEEDVQVQSNNTCLVNANYRISCGLGKLSMEKCEELDCCYNEKSSECYHYLPSKYGYENVKNKYSPMKKNTPLLTPMLHYVEMAVTIQKEKLRINLKQSNEGRNVVKIANENEYFKAEIDKDTLALKILRQNTKNVLLSTEKGPLIASDGYWEWSIHLTKSHLFGLDELHINNKTTTRIFYKNFKEHNTIPAFIANTNGRFHGALIEHEGPLELTVLPSKLIDLRGLGSEFTINLVIGPTPKDIYRQFNTENFIVPIQTLKPHICRFDNLI